MPLPESENEMYETLDAHQKILDEFGVWPDPDRDGDFFNDFANRGWLMPNGEPVHNWLALYIARQLHIAF